MDFNTDIYEDLKCYFETKKICRSLEVNKKFSLTSTLFCVTRLVFLFLFTNSLMYVLLNEHHTLKEA